MGLPLPPVCAITSPVWGGVICDDEFLYRRTGAGLGSIWTDIRKSPAQIHDLKKLENSVVSDSVRMMPPCIAAYE